MPGRNIISIQQPQKQKLSFNNPSPNQTRRNSPNPIVINPKARRQSPKVSKQNQSKPNSLQQSQLQPLKNFVPTFELQGQIPLTQTQNNPIPIISMLTSPPRQQQLTITMDSPSTSSPTFQLTKSSTGSGSTQVPVKATPEDTHVISEKSPKISTNGETQTEQELEFEKNQGHDGYDESSSTDSLDDLSFMHWTPPHLEVLTDVKMISVRQQQDERDSITSMDMTGFDRHNAYNIFDETTSSKMIFQAVEKTDRQMKKKGHRRLYVIEIHDIEGEIVLTLERSQSSYLGDGIEITLADGTLLGGIRSGCTCVCCSTYFDVFDSTRTTLLYIEDRGWCSREFAVVKRHDKSKIVAYLSKKFLNSVQESKSDADVYLLELRYFEDTRIKESEAKGKASKKSLNSSIKQKSGTDKESEYPQHTYSNRLRNINAIINRQIDLNEVMLKQATRKKTR